MIWKIFPDLDTINNFNQNTLVSHLGIEITEVGLDFVKAKMPVDQRTKQPMGLLHGGASLVLSESMGSMASWLVSGDSNAHIVGVEINANHLKSVSAGYVMSITKPVKLGKTLHIWNTEIFDENEQLLCVSRLTVMIIKKT
jgi:1,4-dihydroxy-2-naphthoyl-CoA hydrolase